MAVAKGYGETIQRFFNGGKMPRDYCQWDEEPAPEPQAEAKALPVVPVVEIKPVDKWANVPLPRHSKSLDRVLAEKVAQLHKGLDSSEMLDRYLGRV